MLSVQNHGVETQSRDLDNPQVLLATLQDIRQSVYQEGQEILSQWEPYIQRDSFIKSAENKGVLFSFTPSRFTYFTSSFNTLGIVISG